MRGITRYLLILLLLIASGNANAGLREVKPGESVDLKPNEGLVMMVLDSNIPIQSASIMKHGSFGGHYVLTSPKAGLSRRLLVAEQGSYNWSEIDMEYRYFRLEKDKEYSFNVKPGIINYPGDLVFRTRDYESAQIHFINHGLGQMDWLAQNNPAIAEKYDFEYSGAYPDPFPAFYRQENKKYFLPFDNKIKQLPKIPDVALGDGIWRERRIHDIQLSPDASFISEVINVGDKKKQLDIIDFKAAKITKYADLTELDDLTWVSKDAFVVSYSNEKGYVTEFVRITGSQNNTLIFDAVKIPRSGSVLDPLIDDPDYFLFASWAQRRYNTVYIYKVSKTEPASLRKSGSYSENNRINKELKNDIYWITNASGEIAAAIVRADTGNQLVVRKGDSFQIIRNLPEKSVFIPFSISLDGKELFVITDENRSQRELVKMDLETGRNVTTVFSKDGIDIESVIMNSKRQPVGAKYYVEGKVINTYFDEASDVLNRELSSAFPDSNISVIGKDASDNAALVYVDSSVLPGSVYLFDKKNKIVEKIDDDAPWLSNVKFGTSRVIRTKARDGLVIESYITFPASAPHPLFPMVVMPHGGPIGIRDSRHFDADVQYLTSLGYAVLQVNFRGSEGFGKNFLQAGKGSFGTAIEDDVDASINAALKEFPVDSGKMCIVGTSYGGYSALVSVMRWPDRFKCAVSFSGVSDRILSFTASDSIRVEENRKWMEDYFGNPLTDLEKMKSEQPLYAYRKIAAPVLIIHGTKDLRVDYENALRLQRMLALAGNPPDMLTLINEGHGYTNQLSKKVSWEVVAGFLALHLQTSPGETQPR